MSLDELETLIANATPGPWKIDRPTPGTPKIVAALQGKSMLLASMELSPSMDADARFIAAMRMLAPAMLETLRSAETLINNARPHGLKELDFEAYTKARAALEALRPL